LVTDNLADFSESQKSIGKVELRTPAAVDDAEEKLEIERLRRELSELARVKETLESDLTARRNENHRLKRELGRIRHEIAFANRGPGKVRSGSG
jgi:predicted RNase H-like nuclease (RuvC/YqgF family)